MTIDSSYLALLKQAQSGYYVEGRNGNVYSSFGLQFYTDLLYDGFPMLNLRAMSWKVIVAEALWYLSGSTSIKPLQAQGVRIWDKWADKDGELGPVYGAQWRAWNGVIDQVTQIERDLVGDPYSRRHLVSAWNVSELPRMALPPCPFAWQLHAFKTACHEECLSMTVYQRSADIIVGVPHDIAVHALLLCMFAHISKRTPRQLTFQFGDCHLYESHLYAYEKLVRRASKEETPPTEPRLRINNTVATSVLDFKHEDFDLLDYNPWPKFRVEAHL